MLSSLSSRPARRSVAEEDASRSTPLFRLRRTRISGSNRPVAGQSPRPPAFKRSRHRRILFRGGLFRQRYAPQTRPSRAVGARVARWVHGLEAGDDLYLVGDVCDFWFASRRQKGDPMTDPALRALADFGPEVDSSQSCRATTTTGSAPSTKRPSARALVPEPLLVEAHGLRIHLVHGHRTGGRPPWKGIMESQAFLKSFEHLPAVIADRLDHVLESRNDESRERDERRIMPHYRRIRRDDRSERRHRCIRTYSYTIGRHDVNATARDSGRLAFPHKLPQGQRPGRAACHCARPESRSRSDRPSFQEIF